MTDNKTIRLVIALVGAIALIGSCAIGLLSWQEKDIPDALLAVATGALGSLTSMLVSTRGTSDATAGTVTADVSVTAPVEDGHSDVDTLLLVLVAVGVFLLLVGVTLR